MLFLTAASSFSGQCFGLGETQVMVGDCPTMMPWVAFARPGGTLACQRTGLTDFRGEVGDEGFLLAAGVCGDGLPLRAGDFHRFAIVIEFGGEIGQMEFVRVGAAPTDGGLDMFNLLLLENYIGFWAAVTAIGVDGFQVGTLFQVG